MGFTSDDVVVKINDRTFAQTALAELGVTGEQLDGALAIIDASPKLSEQDMQQKCLDAGLQEHLVPCYLDKLRMRIDAHAGVDEPSTAPADPQDQLFAVLGELDRCGVRDWCEIDPGIVRGLAYYTGTVFEVHAKTGTERALAGGGRYDKLVELFGGPSTPAVGIAMGDVVIRLMLEDRGLLEEAEAYLPRPDVFVISALDDGGKAMGGLIAELRRAGLHARHSYKATKNVGKLLGEAGKARARCAVIIGAEWEEGTVVVKDLETKDQVEVPAAELVDRVRALARAQSGKE